MNTVKIYNHIYDLSTLKSLIPLEYIIIYYDSIYDLST